jgi:putative endonuclease
MQSRNCRLLREKAEWSAVNWLGQLRIGGEERLIAGLDWLAEYTGRNKPIAPHLKTGLRGEDAASFYLRRKGFYVVARRWSSGSGPGDIDLIAWKGPILCFVEVKTRTAHDMLTAEAAVDAHKRAILRRLARQYVRQLPQPDWPPVRFDIVSVYLIPGQPREIVHFEGAFGMDQRERPEDRY